MRRSARSEAGDQCANHEAQHIRWNDCCRRQCVPTKRLTRQQLLTVQHEPIVGVVTREPGAVRVGKPGCRPAFPWLVRVAFPARAPLDPSRPLRPRLLRFTSSWCWPSLGAALASVR
jgi:hypothetical protein